MTRRRALRFAMVVAVIAVVVSAAALLIESQPGALASIAGSVPSAAPLSPPTQALERRTMALSESLDGTLGFAGSNDVVGNLPGIVTKLPEPGEILERGAGLYELNGSTQPALLYGTRPAWRAMGAGMSDGADVRQLEGNLVDLGFMSTHRRPNRHWDAATTAAVKQWQRARHVQASGQINFGEIVFLPGPIRVSEQLVPLGARVGSGTPILRTSTTERVVDVKLDSERAGIVSAAMAVSVSLPDGTTTAGMIDKVGRVAVAGRDQGGQPGKPTIDVDVSLVDPNAVTKWDVAPVGVVVVRERHENVLAAPVAALLAPLAGGYALEVQGASGSRIVAVELGLFEDGWVEVRSPELQVGDRVTTPP